MQLGKMKNMWKKGKKMMLCFYAPRKKQSIIKKTTQISISKKSGILYYRFMN